MTDPTPPRKRRRWFTLSLRGLMLMILIVGIPMGWKARRASLQRRAVARIEQWGGSVEYDWQELRTEPDGPEWLRRMLGDEYFQEVTVVTLPDLNQRPLPDAPNQDTPSDGPEWRIYREEIRKFERTKVALDQDNLACLEGLDQIETLRLMGPAPKSEGLTRLSRLSRLKELRIRGPINAEGLAQVSKLSELESLYVRFKLSGDASVALLAGLPSGLKVLVIDADYWSSPEPIEAGRSGPSLIADQGTDAWLARLGKLHNLTCLYVLDSPEITDGGLAHLKGLVQLEGLSLHQSHRITDVGFSHLKVLPNLRTLDLASATGITDAGLAELANLKKLASLNLAESSKVTDAGVDHLAEVENLKTLTLNARSLTNAGLLRLASLKKLRALVLTGTKIDGGILDRLKTANPSLGIMADRIKASSTSPAIKVHSQPLIAAPRN